GLFANASYGEGHAVYHRHMAAGAVDNNGNIGGGSIQIPTCRRPPFGPFSFIIPPGLDPSISSPTLPLTADLRHQILDGVNKGGGAGNLSSRTRKKKRRHVGIDQPWEHPAPLQIHPLPSPPL